MLPPVIVGPGVGKAACLVVLTDQLVGTVVYIAGGIGAVADCEDIAVGIIGIAAAVMPGAVLHPGDLSAGAVIGIGGIQHRCFHAGDLVQHLAGTSVIFAPGQD